MLKYFASMLSAEANCHNKLYIRRVKFERWNRNIKSFLTNTNPSSINNLTL